jgi:aminoglycoside 2''-phosphotransferase
MSTETDLLNRLFTYLPGIKLRTARSTRGQFNDILIINDELVFRFPRSPHAAETMAKEVVILRALQGQVSLAIPMPSHYVQDERTGKPVLMGYRVIRGSSLTVGDLTEAGGRVASQVATFLRELHAIPLKSIPLELPVAETAADWNDLFNRIRENLYPFMRSDARREVDRSFEKYLGELRHFTFHPRLRHGDFGATNILFDRTVPTVTGIIDFGSAGPGDPAQDIGALLATLGRPFVDKMAVFYPETEAMLARATFFVRTYALQQALSALRDGDRELFEDGISRFT